MSMITERRTAPAMKEFDTGANTGEFVIGFIWLAFYLGAVVISIASPIISTSTEIASHISGPAPSSF